MKFAQDRGQGLLSIGKEWQLIFKEALCLLLSVSDDLIFTLDFGLILQSQFHFADAKKKFEANKTTIKKIKKTPLYLDKSSET